MMRAEYLLAPGEGGAAALSPHADGDGGDGGVRSAGQGSARPAWQHERPEALLRHVQRLTAANPSAMTGPGTNTYLIGEAATGYAVIDPGPVDANDAARSQQQHRQHIERILAHTGGDVRYILCTHSHPDHSPAAAPLQAAVAASGRPRPVIAGMASGPHARSDSRFAPERALATGDTLALHGTRANAQGQMQAVRHTLHALHTPGHTFNHLCFVLEEDGLLLSGDHILGGSTTVILPPDGCMQAFLDSLDALDAACLRWDIAHILPAHGPTLAQPRQVIARLKAHRLAREAKVQQAMQQRPGGGVDDWLALAYADTPVALWPVARLSLLAHVQRLARLHPQWGLDGEALVRQSLAGHDGPPLPHG